MQDPDWKAAWKRLPQASPGPCPPPEDIAAFVGGERKDAFLAHLSACEACREDVVAARSEDKASASTSLRLRLYRLLPARPSILPRLAVAAAVLFVLVLGAVLFWPRRPEAEPVVNRPPKPPSLIKEPIRAPELPPEKPVPAPEPVPAPPAPTPAPVPPPPASKPMPEPAPPEVPKPVPAPEKPAVPAPAPTRVALKGSVFAITGGCTAQADGDAAALSLRLGQKRDFAGMVKLKADSSAGKLRVGTVTYYLQRGAELSLLLEEGQTTARLAKGEAFFDVLPGQGSFLVDTALGRVSVKGTRFLVSAEKVEMDVVLQKGAVEVIAAERTIALAAGEEVSVPAGKPQKADLAKRLSWVRSLEDSILIQTDQMGLQGGMAILADPTASGGRAIGLKAAPKPGQEAVAEILARRKQAAPYVVWVRLHWAHQVPAAMSLKVGEGLTWSSKDVVASPAWQWVRVGSVELPEERFRVRVSDTQVGTRIDQILITSDPEFHPENK